MQHPRIQKCVTLIGDVFWGRVSIKLATHSMDVPEAPSAQQVASALRLAVLP